MARKRITEQDLLNFRTQAEVLAEEVGTKYEELDRAKQVAPEPVREMGLLILTDEDEDGARRFAKRAYADGLAVERANIPGYHPIDRFDRTPEWQRRLIQAQIAYTLVSKRARRVAVIGHGRAVPLAALISEQYPVDALITIGALTGNVGDRVGRRAYARIRRIAKNNLFSIVCPILAIRTGDMSARASASCRVFSSGTRSQDVQMLEIRGADMANLFTERENELAEAVYEFLDQG